MVALKLEPGIKRLLFIKDCLFFLFSEKGNLVITNRGSAIWEFKVNINLLVPKDPFYSARCGKGLQNLNLIKKRAVCPGR